MARRMEAVAVAARPDALPTHTFHTDVDWSYDL
jgi:hypothetical protein